MKPAKKNKNKNPKTRDNYKALISSLIRNLPELEQKTLAMHYVEGLTLREIAMVLETDLQQVQDAYQKAMLATVYQRN